MQCVCVCELSIVKAQLCVCVYVCKTTAWDAFFVERWPGSLTPLHNLDATQAPRC